MRSFVLKIASLAILTLVVLFAASPLYAQESIEAAKVRVVSFLYHPKQTALAFSGKSVVGGLASGEMTPFGDYPEGTYDLLATDRNSGEKIATGSLELKNKRPATVVLFGDPSGSRSLDPAIKVYQPTKNDRSVAPEGAANESYVSITILNADPLANTEIKYPTPDGLKSALIIAGNEFQMDAIEVGKSGFSVNSVPLDGQKKASRVSLPLQALKPGRHYLLVLHRPYGPDIPPAFTLVDLSEGGFVGTQEAE